MNGRQNFLLLQKNMAKVGGPQCEGFDATFNIPKWLRDLWHLANHLAYVG